MTDREIRTQVVVVGAGNAAMAAAVAARETGAEVVVLEKAPRTHRGGNSALTIQMRFPYSGVDDLLPLIPDFSASEEGEMREQVAGYSEQEYWDDIMSVTEGLSDKALAGTLVRQAHPTVEWMRGLGHEWEPTFKNPLSANAVSFAGGGYNLLERWFAAGRRRGIQVHYEARATELIQDSRGIVTGVRVLRPSGFHTYHADAVVLACGSFESSPEMRARYLGTGWDSVKLRGVPYNTGDGLLMALGIGALSYGSWTTCHASPQDFNRPAYDLPGPGVAGDYWSRYAYPYSVMVNLDGRRFVDEGATWRGLTYARMGRAILAQPEAKAFQVFDAKHRDMGLLERYQDAEVVRAGSLEALGRGLGIRDVESFVATLREYNAAVQPGEFDAFRPDGKAAANIDPPRCNWALPIDSPPFEGYAVTCGMTFCYGGLQISSEGEVLHTLDRPIPGLYAAGEMVGGLWAWNYPSGGGMMAGAVFGRIAGRAAGRFAGV
ncbi:MAG: FAD-dependent tricarballylate dehydrogenase TcuA [Chloroflexota bacterium]|nr:FAD-dependent tricarballylate dehydrogenase TcuA [Chloroflexota bacterium]